MKMVKICAILAVITICCGCSGIKNPFAKSGFFGKKEVSKSEAPKKETQKTQAPVTTPAPAATPVGESSAKVLPNAAVQK